MIGKKNHCDDFKKKNRFWRRDGGGIDLFCPTLLIDLWRKRGREIVRHIDIENWQLTWNCYGCSTNISYQQGHERNQKEWKASFSHLNKSTHFCLHILLTSFTHVEYVFATRAFLTWRNPDEDRCRADTFSLLFLLAYSTSILFIFAIFTWAFVLSSCALCGRRLRPTVIYCQLLL